MSRSRLLRLVQPALPLLCAMGPAGPGASAQDPPAGNPPGGLKPAVQDAPDRDERDVKQRDVEQRLEAVEEELARMRTQLEAEQAMKEDFSLGPKLTLKGFAHVQFGVQHFDSDDDAQDNSADAFSLGNIDLFINSQLSDDISFMTETGFEPDEEGDNHLDVERLIIKYEFGDYLNVQVGRFHTTMGYWNEFFHHGEWLQTSIGRPSIVKFESSGGPLPMHLVGLVFKGTQSCSAADFDYTLEIGNGRGRTPDPPQIVVDANDSKAVNLALGMRPAAVPGMRVGANLYVDRIPPNDNPGKGSLHRSMDERILGVYATYTDHPWEFLAEYFDFEHDGRGFEARSNGWYLQAGRRFEDWVPYLRVDSLHLDDDDQYYESVDDELTFAVGLRWDVADWNALKVQIAHTLVDGGAGEPDARITSITFQTAFVF